MNALPEIAAVPPWVWFAAGLLLCAIEVFIPGAFLLWFGLAALATGVAALWLPLGFEAGLALFSAAAVACVLIGRAVYGARSKTDGADDLNLGAEGFIGHDFVLDRGIENGAGSIRVRDSVWRVEGPSAPAGTRVRVTGVVNGVLLQVEPAD